MIALHHQALLIFFADGHIEPLNMHDLVVHLAHDFPKAGDRLQPWVVEKAVESLIRHFRADSRREYVSLGEFVKTAHALLDSFVRETMNGAEEKGQLDLFATARGCGFGFELEFFAEIRRFFSQKAGRVESDAFALPDGQNGSAPEESVRPIRVTGLHRCAKFLAGRCRWSKRCSQVRDEIVSFIREELACASSGRLSVSILS